MRNWIAGWIMCSAFTSLNQDFIGKEKYIAACNLLWMDPMITVPIAIFMIIACFGIIDFRNW